MPGLAIVVPFHNEERNVPKLYARLRALTAGIDRDRQFVFVDDGSTDRTYPLLQVLAEIDPQVTVIRLRRNVGRTAALAAGFAHSNGQYVIAIDGDLRRDAG